MKKTLFMFLVALFAGCSICFAQDNNQQPPQGFGPGGPGGPRMDPKQRIENMIKELNLSDQQAEQFRVVMEEQQKQMREEMEQNRQQMNGERPTQEQMEQMRAKMEEKRQAINTVLQLILTEDQFKKYQELSQRRGPRGGQGGPQGAPQGDFPPQQQQN